VFGKLRSNPLFEQAGNWAKLIGITGSAQIGVQGIGLLSGILIIRLLPTTEYAFYTIGNTMLGTMVMLANAGIPIGVMAQGGQVWDNKEKLGEVLVTGFDLRKKFIFGSLLVGIPILLYLLKENGASWWSTLLLISVLIPSFFSSLTTNLLEIAPKLKQDIVRLQKVQLGVNLGRLALLVPLVYIFPYAFLALVPISVSQIIGNIKLKKIISEYVDWKQKINLTIRKKILGTVKRILPEAIYYGISGQITIWLLSIFGSTTSLAQIGALGRIAMIVNLVAILCNTLITPRFARLPNNYKIIVSRFFQVLAIVLLTLGLLVFIVYLLPSQILWVIGPNYAGLEYEILLAVIGSCLSTFAGIAFWLYSSRGWVLNPSFSIPLSILTLIGAILLTDVSTLEGVLILNIIVGGMHLILHLGYGFFKINTLKSIDFQ
jgi:O-antigen/teichoic acid export membrane protein